MTYTKRWHIIFWKVRGEILECGDRVALTGDPPFPYGRLYFFYSSPGGGSSGLSSLKRYITLV